MRILLIQNPECSSKQSNSIYEAWDYSFQRVTLVITASLASCVLPLSTRCLSAILVPLSDAFFGVWQLTRRNMLFVHLSSACLASSSTPLRVYAFFPNNYLSLASLSKPNSLSCRVLITFHILPEQSLRFNCLCLCLKQVRLPFRQLPSIWSGVKDSNLQSFETYFDVLLLLLRILLETKYNTPTVFQLAAY